MTPRIFGLETEFGCLVREARLGPPERVVERVKTAAFEEGWGFLDRHTRDSFFEPSEAGGFLLNGGRLYIDAVGSHLEYSTPECRSLRDLVTFDKAGQRLIQRLICRLGWEERVSFYNNSVDHFGGHTFGCHENYSLEPDGWSSKRLTQSLVPFLVTRQIYAGTGRVGGHRLTSRVRQATVQDLSRHAADYVYLDQIYGVEPDPLVEFQLSQRADHILHVVSGRVRFRRALINPKWDDIHSLCRYPRLHLLFGESNPNEVATALKVGTTALVLDLIEEGFSSDSVALTDPLRALKAISRDPSWRWIVQRQKGGTILAVDLQRMYLREAQRRFAGRDEQTDWVLREWEGVLDALESDPMRLADRVDWVAKRQILDLYRRAEGLSWADEPLFSLDLEYHNIDPARGLYYGLQEADRVRRLSDEEAIESALRRPPQDTRAAGRGLVVRGLVRRGVLDCVVEWDGILADGERALLFENPFHPYTQEAQRFLRRL